MRLLDSTPGNAMETKTVTLTDTSQTLAAAYTAGATDIGTSPQVATACLLVCRGTNAARIAFKVDPTQGSDGLGIDLIPATSQVASYMLVGREDVQACRIVNATNGANAILTIQPFDGGV